MCHGIDKKLSPLHVAAALGKVEKMKVRLLYQHIMRIFGAHKYLSDSSSRNLSKATNSKPPSAVYLITATSCRLG